MPPLTKLRLSASQIDTADTCLTQWWLSKIAKCKQPFDRKLLLGEVGHGVCENFLQDLPLYPEGWTAPINRFTGRRAENHITTTEQALVKALITKSIEEGALLKHPDTEVEKEFPCKKLGKKSPVRIVGDVEGVEISLIGFIDHFYGNHVDDHKFTGAPRYYGQTKLAKATAMNLYAWAMFEEGYIKEDSAWLRYNLFVKDIRKPVVKVVQVEKSKEDIYKFYHDHIETMYRPMALAAKNCTSWHQVDSAMKQGKAKQACEKYGGCPYMDICMGRVSVDDYKERFNTKSLSEKKNGQKDVLNNLLSGTNNTTKTPKGEESTKMPGFLQKLQKNVAEAPVQTGEAPVAKTEPVVDQAEAVEQVIAEAQAPAPWAFADCPMCKDSDTPGILKGEPCNICDISTKALKEKNPDQPVLADYDVTVSDEGLVTWADKAGEVVAESEPVEAEPVVKETVQSLSGSEFEEEPAVAEQKVEEKTTIKEAPMAPVAESEAPIAQGGPLDNIDVKDYATERKGFILSYNRIQSRKRLGKKLGDPTCLTSPAEIMDVISGGLLAAANASGAQAREWLDLDFFKRRDLIMANAQGIAEIVNNSMIDASDVVKASDEDNLCCAIARYALIVIGERS